MAEDKENRMAHNFSPNSYLLFNGENSGPNSRPNSRPTSPQRYPKLPKASDLDATLQKTVERISQTDVDKNAMVYLSNCPEATRKMEDLLPIHFYSWELKSIKSVLVYTLLHMFVLQAQNEEMMGERSTYQKYVAQLKNRIAQLEEKLQEAEDGDGEERGRRRGRGREEVLRLRRENAELRQKNEKLLASERELFQVNDAWSRDYESLNKRVAALTSGSWTNSSHPPSHPPSIAHNGVHIACPTCHDFEEQLNSLQRQMTQMTEKLQKTIKAKDEELKRKDLMIERVDNENQAVQMQIQEIGDLQKAVTLKDEHRKLELQMAQKQRQYQDTLSEKLQLQQQVNKLRFAFMSIFGIGGNRINSFRRDCRAQQYMSEPLPPPPTPPGLIARGDHFGSLVEKDRQRRVLYDEQVTGFERALPNLSLPDPHTWPKEANDNPRPKTLLPHTNGIHQKGKAYLACPTCTKQFRSDSKAGYDSWFDHISYCGPKR